jgi:hypothetical protein
MAAGCAFGDHLYFAKEFAPPHEFIVEQFCSILNIVFTTETWP